MRTTYRIHPSVGISAVAALLWLAAGCSANSDEPADTADTAAPADTSAPRPTGDTAAPNADTSAPRPTGDTAAPNPDSTQPDQPSTDTTAPDSGTPDTAAPPTDQDDTDTCPAPRQFQFQCEGTWVHDMDPCEAAGYIYDYKDGQGYCIINETTVCPLEDYLWARCAPDANLCFQLGFDIDTDAAQIGIPMCVDSDGCNVDYMNYIGCWIVQNPDQEFRWPLLP